MASGDAHDDYDTADLVSDVVILVLYCIVIVFVACIYILWNLKQRGREVLQVGLFNLYHLFLALFLIVRLLAICLRLGLGWGIGEYFAGNMASLLFYTTHTLALLIWFSKYHKKFFGWGPIIIFLKWGLLALNIFFYVTVIITSIIFPSIANYEDHHLNPAYQLSLALLACFGVVLMLVAILYMIKLIIHLVFDGARDATATLFYFGIKPLEFFLLFLKLLLFTTLFILPLIAWIAALATDSVHPTPVFTFLFYGVPEIGTLAINIPLLYLLRFREAQAGEIVSSLFETDLTDSFLEQNESGFVSTAGSGSSVFSSIYHDPTSIFTSFRKSTAARRPTQQL